MRRRPNLRLLEWCVQGVPRSHLNVKFQSHSHSEIPVVKCKVRMFKPFFIPHHWQQLTLIAVNPWKPYSCSLLTHGIVVIHYYTYLFANFDTETHCCEWKPYHSTWVRLMNCFNYFKTDTMNIISMQILLFNML